MHLPRLATWLFARLYARVALQRPPDFIVGADSAGGAYLNRWYLTPWRHWQHRLGQVAEASPTRWNRLRARCARLLPNLYLHQFLRDDEDRALHNHPSFAVSFMLVGPYTEHTIAAGGIHQRQCIAAGRLRFLRTRHTHRIELPRVRLQSPTGGSIVTRQTCWTLFLFGPTVRNWGFHHPQRGWIPWQDWIKEFGA